MLCKQVSRIRGQAAVETAIVMPLTVFIMLGVIQVSLLSQARAMVKYAAFRAARAGAMHNACKDKMRDAAAGALVPVTSLTNHLLPATSAIQYATSYMMLKQAAKLGGAFPGAIDIRICGPLKDGNNSFFTGKEKVSNQIDFDDPFVNSEQPGGSGVKELRYFERTKLKVQVKYNYKLIIPFADRIIHNIWVGKRGSAALWTAKVKGSGPQDAGGNGPVKYGRAIAAESIGPYKALAMAGIYVMPLYASYAMRMQSNFFESKCQLPQENECWNYGDKGKP